MFVEFGPPLLEALRRAAASDKFHLHLGFDPWIYCDPIGESAPIEDWKLHISAYEWSAAQVLRSAIGVLAGEGLHFKVTADSRVLARLNRGEFGMGQVGKFMTIYPASSEHAQAVAARLHTSTIGLGGPAIAHESRAASGSLVHFRHVASDGGFLAPTRIIAGRYAVIEWLRRPSGYLGIALDTTTGRSVIVKAARYGEDRGPRFSTTDALCREAYFLRMLPLKGVVPQSIELVPTSDYVFLVAEDLRCEPLAAVVRRRMEALDPVTLLMLADRIGAAVERIHACGIVHGDLSPTNVLLAADETVAIVDFETARAFGSTDDDRAATPGYSSQGRRGESSATAEHDIFSLGALFYFAATRRDPAAGAPRDLRLRNPTVSASFAATITACMAADPARRPTTVVAVRRCLLEGDITTERETPFVFGPPDLSLQIPILVDGLLAAMELTLRHPEASSLQRSDLGIGWGGPMVVLIASDADRERVASLARSLIDLPSSRGHLGLFAGDAGKAFVLSRAFAANPDNRFLAVIRRILLSRHELRDGENPDVFGGVAGLLRTCVSLWQLTREQAYLDRAVECGEWLLRHVTRLESARSRVCVPGWIMPVGHGSLSGRGELGYAHGTAGIGDALIDLAGETGDPRLLHLVAEIGETLTSCAHIDNAANIATWPRVSGEPPVASHWCHGAGGIARFLARAGRVLGASDLLRLSLAGARAAIATAWSAEGGQCHGIAGAIETVLDVHAAAESPLPSELGRLIALLAMMLTGDEPLPSIVSEWSFLEGRAGALAALIRCTTTGAPSVITAGRTHEESRDSAE